MYLPRPRLTALLICATCLGLGALTTGCVSIFSDDSAFVEGTSDDTGSTSGDTEPLDGTSEDIPTSTTTDGTSSGTDDTDGTSSGTDDADDASDASDQDTAVEPFTPAVVHIEPPQPKTLDDLTVVIDQDAVHIRDNLVTYEYAWTKDGQAVTEAEGLETVGNALTTKAEVWTVSVTPVSGSDRGQPATASVTIENTRPVVKNGSLDNYTLFADAEVNVRFGEVFDADADQVAPVVRWFRVRGGQDTQITLTGLKLNLATQTWQADDMLRIELSAYDNEGPQAEGPKLILGPLPIYQPAPHWKPLYPSLAGNDGPGGTMVFDPFNLRLLFLNQGVLWEAALPAPGLPPQWVVLNPAPLDNMEPGTSPFFFFPIIVFDEGADYKRLLFIGAAGNSANVSESEIFAKMRIVELDVTHRGGERWIERTPVLGTHPPFALIPSVLHDEARDQVLVFGGLGFGSSGGNTVYNELWSLSLALRGGETWTQITANAAVPPRGGAIWLHEPGTDRTLLVGGFGVKTQPSTVYEYLTDVWSYDLSADPPTFEPLITTSPGQIAGVIETFDQPDGNGLVMTTSAATGHKLWRYDFDSQIFAEIQGTQPPASSDDLQIFTGFLVPESDRLVMNTFGTSNNSNGLEAFSFDFTAGQWSKLVSSAEDSPGGLSKMLVAFDNYDRDAFYVHGGRNDNDIINDKLWKFDLTTNTWSQVTAIPDPTYGTPTPRFGHGSGGYVHDWNSVAFFSGVGPNNVGLSDAWRLLIDRDTLSWNRFDLPNPPPVPIPPSPREGLVSLTDCFYPLHFFGGYPPNDPWNTLNDPLDASWMLQSCNYNGDLVIDCTWYSSPYNPPAILPMYRSYVSVAAINRSMRQTIYFGGQSNMGITNELWTLSDCYNWTQITPAGPIPLPRSGATLILNQDTEELTNQRFYLFGGTDDLYGYSSSQSGPQNEVWALDRLGVDSFRWSPLVITGPKPTNRAHHGAIWDRDRSQMVVFGGRRLGDVWAFVPGTAP